MTTSAGPTAIYDIQFSTNEILESLVHPWLTFRARWNKKSEPAHKNDQRQVKTTRLEVANRESVDMQQ